MARRAKAEVIPYQPPGETIEAFFASESPHRFIRGPVGSGKTTACVIEILRRCQAQAPGPDGYRRSKWLVTRSTYAELESTTLASWKQWIPDSLGQITGDRPKRQHLKFNDVRAEIIFLALEGVDDVHKLAGLELTGAWLNECMYIPFQLVTKIDERIGRYPPMRWGGPTWQGMVGDTNAPDEENWFYKLSEIQKPEGWSFFTQPPGVYWDPDAQKWVPNPSAENLDNLPEGYYHRQLAARPEQEIKVYLANQYGFVQKGQAVFPEFDDTAHVGELMVQPDMPLYLGCDWGLMPAAVICQQFANGRVVIIDELTTHDMGGVGAVRFSEMLSQRLNRDYPNFTIAGIWGDPRGDQRSQSDESTVFQIMAAHDFDVVPTWTNDFTIRREAVAHMFTRLIEGRPALMIDSRCTTLRRGLAGGYIYRRIRLAGGEERYQDMPDKNAVSHVCDALQYLALGLGEGQNVLRRTRKRTAQQPMQETDYSVFGHQ